MKNLYKAISEVQKVLYKIEKSADNPFFKSKYVPLDKVWDKLHPELQKNSLLVLQNPIGTGDSIGVETHIIHTESGEDVKSSYLLPLSKKDPQAGGSALTYARRYALMSIFGLCPVDDDGESATDHIFEVAHDELIKAKDSDKAKKIIKNCWKNIDSKQKEILNSI